MKCAPVLKEQLDRVTKTVPDFGDEVESETCVTSSYNLATGKELREVNIERS